ncbi:hypothetical protein BDB00DRAFT_817467 [Zychaea mexicana]|uniref:uncharacterized protein n=1 Tax=Zychaea mexicana TaxID=64656 RepID=UPI0022FF3F99|nr:uncharacterized protein BDB00DRAFT_817467 [Zychaea mexicana]KAI9494603.1 hypothetical protein BDB00DRAFT_817467 [Zychaea mexicana]
MENPEPIVVIKRESTPTGQPPVVLITGVFIKEKRPIIVDERRDQSKELMVFDRRSTTTVSKEFSTPGFYPLDATHGPLMSLLAAVRLLDPVESQSSSTTSAAPQQNSNNSNNQNSQFSYPMMLPQNSMYYGMPVRPGVPPIPSPANLPPQLLPVLQPYLFGQQQQQQQQQQLQQHHSIHNQHHHRHPVHSQQHQQQHHSIPSQQSYHHPSSYTQRKPVQHAALAAAVAAAGNSRSSPALTPGGGPTELRNSSMSPMNHRIQRKQPQYLSNNSSNTPDNNNNNNNKSVPSSSPRRVRFAKKNQVFNYDVEEEDYNTHHYGDRGDDIDDNDESDQWEEYEEEEEEEDDAYYGNADQNHYYYDDQEDDIRRIRRPWTSPRMIAREQPHDVYSFPSSRATSRFPSTGSSRRKGRRQQWPVVSRSTLHLHDTEV